MQAPGSVSVTWSPRASDLGAGISTVVVRSDYHESGARRPGPIERSPRGEARPSGPLGVSSVGRIEKKKEGVGRGSDSRRPEALGSLLHVEVEEQIRRQVRRRFTEG